MNEEMVQKLCGWIPPDQRTREEAAMHEAAVLAMADFKIVGTRRDTNKAVMWDCSRAANGGEHFLVFWQQTGSCCGNGLGQAGWYLSAAEVVRLGDPEQVLLPFWLLPYGKSRQYAGMRGRGEGSMGSTTAKAAQVDGFMPANTPGLPQASDGNGYGLTWGEKAELEWSDGAAIAPKWLEQSRKHLVKTVAHIKSVDDAREALRNYYPLTIAADWGGDMQCRTAGTKYPVLLNGRRTTWNHQQCVLGFWDHPELGELYYILNSWRKDAHGVPPDDSPPGGYWVKKADMAYIIGCGETFAFSQFDGFPAQELELTDFKVFGS